MGNCGYRLQLRFLLKTIQSIWVMDNSSRYQQQAIQSPHCTLHVFECEMFEKNTIQTDPLAITLVTPVLISFLWQPSHCFQTYKRAGKRLTNLRHHGAKLARGDRTSMQVSFAMTVWKRSETQFSRNKYEKWDHVRLEIQLLQIDGTLVRFWFRKLELLQQNLTLAWVPCHGMNWKNAAPTTWPKAPHQNFEILIMFIFQSTWHFQFCENGPISFQNQKSLCGNGQQECEHWWKSEIPDHHTWCNGCPQRKNSHFGSKLLKIENNAIPMGTTWPEARATRHPERTVKTTAPSAVLTKRGVFHIQLTTTTTTTTTRKNWSGIINNNQQQSTINNNQDQSTTIKTINNNQDRSTTNNNCQQSKQPTTTMITTTTTILTTIAWTTTTLPTTTTTTTTTTTNQEELIRKNWQQSTTVNHQQ